MISMIFDFMDAHIIGVAFTFVVIAVAFLTICSEDHKTIEVEIDYDLEEQFEELGL